MRFTVQDRNLKVFASALRCLTRLGKREVHLGPKHDVLCLQTLNAAHSAHGEFRFPNNFFSRYDYDPEVVLDSQEGHFHCKVSVKAIQAVVHSLTSSKHIESCTFNIRHSKPIKVTLHYLNKVQKMQIIQVLDWETLELDEIPSEDIPNEIKASAKEFLEAFVSFYSNQSDISLTMTARSLLMQNYVDESQATKRERRTEVRLLSSGFLTYVLNDSSKITFCLKDWRVVLAFARNCSLPVSIKFGSPASPVVCEVSKEYTFEATFAFSTMKPISEVDDSDILRATPSLIDTASKNNKNAAATFRALQKKRDEMLKRQQQAMKNMSLSNNFVKPTMFDLPSTSGAVSANKITCNNKVLEKENQASSKNKSLDQEINGTEELPNELANFAQQINRADNVEQTVHENVAESAVQDENIHPVIDTGSFCVKRKRVDNIVELTDSQTAKKVRTEDDDLTRSQMLQKIRTVFKHCFEHK